MLSVLHVWEFQTHVIAAKSHFKLLNLRESLSALPHIPLAHTLSIISQNLPSLLVP